MTVYPSIVIHCNDCIVMHCNDCIPFDSKLVIHCNDCMPFDISKHSTTHVQYISGTSLREKDNLSTLKTLAYPQK